MRKRIGSYRPVMAAEGDENDFAFDVEDTDDMSDTLDDVADTVDDLQDVVDQIDDAPQDTILDVDNNISNHYIAECERCHEVFISAVVESDTEMDSVQGECPCCHEQTKQYLKWIIRNVHDDEEEPVPSSAF